MHIESWLLRAGLLALTAFHLATRNTSGATVAFEGFVVSFIAPHSLTARALVVAPHDVLRVNNCSLEEPVDVTVDGRPACLLSAGEKIEVRFVQRQSHLAQLPGTSFYRRLREKFGRLAKP